MSARGVGYLLSLASSGTTVMPLACDICGSGYRSEFERSNLGVASNLLGGASNLIGGLWGASSAANTGLAVKTDADSSAVTLMS